MTRVGIVLLMGVGCGGVTEGVGPGPQGTTTGTGAAAETVAPPALTEPDTDWWDVPTGTTAMAGESTGSPSATSEGSDTDEETEGEEEEEDWAGLFFEGDAIPGDSAMGWAEFVVFEEGEDLCILTWTPGAATPVDTCADCEFAFSLTVGPLDIEVDDACAEFGLDPVELEGRTITVGHRGDETVMLERDGEWAVVDEGWSEYLEDEDGFWEWGVELEAL